jgi:hypothetical protein
MAEEKQNNDVAPESEETQEQAAVEEKKAAVEEGKNISDAERASMTTVVMDKKEDSSLKEELAADEDAIVAMLASVTAELEEMRKIRRRQGRYAVTGVVATLAILISFMVNLAHFGQNYPVEELLQQISANSNIVTNSPRVQQVIGSAKNVFFPAYKRELLKRLQDEAPQIEATAVTAVSDFRNFMMTDIRRKMVNRVDKALKQVEKDVIQHYTKTELSPEELDKVFDEVNIKFHEEFTKRLEKRLDAAIKKLVVMNDEFKSFKDTPEYKALKPEDIGIVENRLIETMLKLWIFQLNPEQGEAIVSKGGAK